MGPNLIGHREEITVYTPKGEASGETSLAHTLILGLCESTVPWTLGIRPRYEML